MRSAASRFIYTVYTGSTPWIFVAAGLGAGLLAALGSVKRLARTAELFRPLLLLALLPVLGAAIARLDWGELLPIGVRDIPGMALGALECAGTTGFALTFVPLFETGDAVERRALAMTSWSARMAPLPYRAYRLRAGPLRPRAERGVSPTPSSRSCATPASSASLSAWKRP